VGDSRDRELSSLRKQVRILTRKLEQCQRNRREIGYVKDRLDHVLVREEDVRVEIERKGAELLALTERLKEERRRSETLLTSLLPGPVASELKTRRGVHPRVSECVAVLKADLVGLDRLAGRLSPGHLVAAVDRLFAELDRIAGEHDLEPLRTSGDSYLCVGGLFAEGQPREKLATETVSAALEMIAATRENVRATLPADLIWAPRVSVHTGPLVGGLVGRRRLNFDVWGEAARLASLLATAGEPGRVNVTQPTADACAVAFHVQPRGQIDVTGHEPLEMFFVDHPTT